MKHFRFTLSTAFVALLFAAAAIPAAAQNGPPEGAELIAENLKFPEGPVVDANGTLFFSDTRAGVIYTWDGTTLGKFFEDEDSGVNGLAMDADGVIYACGGTASSILKIRPDGEATTILTEVGGLPLNSPNDIVVDPRGNIFFSNPGGMGGAKEGHAPIGVVRIRPDGSAETVATDLKYPNGVALSPDGGTLYVNDMTGGSTVYKFPLDENGNLGEREVFHKFGSGFTDGITVAPSGNVYVVLFLGAKVVRVSPDGEVEKEYPFQKAAGVTNVCFSNDAKTMYVTVAGRHEVYQIPSDE